MKRFMNFVMRKPQEEDVVHYDKDSIIADYQRAMRSRNIRFMEEVKLRYLMEFGHDRQLTSLLQRIWKYTKKEEE